MTNEPSTPRAAADAVDQQTRKAPASVHNSLDQELRVT